MDDQWVEARPALRSKDRGDGAVAGGVGAEPVDRLGRKRDQPAGTQQFGRPGDRSRDRG